MSTVMKARGLYTFANKLGEIPDGALLEAKNVVIDRDGIIEPRRGFNVYGSAMPLDANRAKQLLVYKNRILRHFGTALQFENSGTFSSFSGTFNETETNLRIKGVEVNGNFYFTTNEGIKKISASNASQLSTSANYITNAGGVKALDLSAFISYDVSGFMEPESKTAYRLIWGVNDLNDNTILGAPSSRTVITNISTTLFANINLSFTIPSDINNTNYYYQLYRTAVKLKGALTLDAIDPGDEMNLVYEASITTADLLAGVINISDITPEDFRVGGLPLYTNPTSGDGILQANDKPPMAKDIALFKNHTFYSNTSTFHRFTFNILGLNGFTSGSTSFIVTDGVIERVYKFVGQKEIATITCDTKANTSSGSYILMYSASNERGYYFWFDKTGSDVEPSASDTIGKIGVKVNITAASSAIQVATTLATAIDAIEDFSSINSGTSIVTTTWFKNGNVTNTAFGLTAPGGIFSISTTQQGDGEDANTLTGGDVLLSSLNSPSQAVDETARSLVHIINEDNSGIINATYLSGPDDLPGNILLERRSLTDTPFYISLNDSAVLERFNPTLPLNISGSASVANPTVITAVAHGLVTGDEIVVHSSTTTPTTNGIRTVTVLTANTFTIPVNVTILGNLQFFKTSAQSSNETVGNRIYYSKPQQPEAVPLLNYFPVGARDKEIKRIIALRDSLFVFKEDAIYRVTGYNSVFNADLFDSSATIIAPDTASVLNNQIYVLTSQGVAVISDTGVGIISRPIESDLTKIGLFTNFSTISFSVSYETDRAYLLWLPEKSTDTYATQCFRYNVFTRTWTRWDKSATCGVVNNVIYIGAADINYIEKEKKTFTIDDFSDRILSTNVLTNRVSGTTTSIASVVNVEIGDVLSQTQYVTIAQFNRLLKRLDVDPFVTDTNYYSTLFVIPGNVLYTNLGLLAQKLDADATVAQTDYFSSISGATTPVGIQSDYNIIINKLNIDSGVKYSDYRLSSGTTIYHSPIFQINTNNSSLVTYAPLPLTSGDAAIVKAISSTVVWAPAHFGAPDQYKQVREGTILFEKDSFTSATVSYKSDLSQNFEPIDFQKSGTGEFGTFVFGDVCFGGDGTEAPIRTLIPQAKQRCRYITCKLVHRTALESFAILGLSFEARAFGSRAYR